jgi:hypothetical protein
MNTSVLRTAASLACLCLVTFSATAISKSKDPPSVWAGLVKKDVKGLDAVFVRPNVTFPAYKKIMFDPVQVAFSKDWDPNSTRDLTRRVSTEDMQKIKDGLAALMREVFTRELAKSGYSLSDSPDEETIRVSTAIAELYINAPDVMTAGRSRTYTTDAGSMTLIMEIRDSPTGQLLAGVVDQRNADTMGGQMQWTNSVTNRADADRIITAWASKLRTALDRLNGKTTK